ncbi:lasso peptide biosynthesis B2 protein [Bacillus sp. NTK074B]|uniref:lasso peptide biosynthesis B2 protein n=1 Tax=Bacillus sp. NTK074B TaxID=2802174 RepID=UPI001A902B11|nr:lasso peptide biosynthesis B2 protein [Bacillus sp. NTK074B]
MLNKIKIYVLFYYYHKLLTKQGMKPVLEELKLKKYQNKNIYENVSVKELIDFCNNIEKVRIKHPLKEKALCLHKSVLAYSLLIRKGIDVKLFIGIAQGEFEAHSWIEYSGTVLNDNHEYVKRKYRTIMEI